MTGGQSSETGAAGQAPTFQGVAYRALFDQAADPILVYGLDGHILEANQMACAQSGYSRDELLKLNVSDLYRGELGKDEALRQWQRWQPGQRFCIQGSLQRKDGSEYPAEVSSSIVYCGEQRFILAIIRDITQRKQEQESLLRTQFAMDRAPDSILWVDGEGRIVYANDAACASMGYPRDELLAMTVFDIDPDFPIERWEEHKANMRRLRSMTFEGRHRAKDGHLFPVEVSTNLFDFSESFLACAFDRDITARKRQEEEREKLQNQLAQAQKMESIGRLAGGIAHDFNNMLGVILGHVEMALEQLTPDLPLAAELHEVRRAAQRSADLTRQLLTFARRQTVTPEILDLNQTVEGMLKMLQRLIGEHITLAWEPGHGIGPIKMDPSQVDQILANLCVNARDAIQDTGRITIGTRDVSFDEADCAGRGGFVPGDYVLLAVSDSGHGMHAETLSRLFEPFFTTKEVGKGTGLGLSTVYGIVKQNNGFIDVYSEPGQGAIFKVYLPRHEGSPLPASKDRSPKPAARGHETILLVEDEAGILRMATIMLERQGYTVVPAATPSEAIRAAEEYPDGIHLLMTDVIMPEMNGRELAAKLRERHPNLKRLFMSGYSADVIAPGGILDEGVFFIQKPFSRTDLAAKIRQALDA